jgi:hypothetical protein
MIVKSILSDYMASQQRTFKNRHLTVGASEIGQCARKIWYIKNLPGAISDEEESFGASHRGNMIEQHTVEPALRKHFGKDILYSGKDQKTLVDGVSSATPDGLLINLPADFLAEFGIKDIGKSRECLVEIKSIDPRIQLRGPKVEHDRQANQQLGVMRETTKHKPEYCLIVYVNASFMDDVAEFVVPYDHDRYLRQKVRAKRILIAKTAREMMPEGWVKGGKQCDYCAFSSACTELRTEVPADSNRLPDPQFVAEMKDLAMKERAYKSTASSAEEEARKMQLEIKDRLTEKKLHIIKTPDLSINWYSVKPRVTYDMDALRQAAEKINFNVAKFEKIGDPSDGLRISVKDAIRPTAKVKGAKVKT